MTDDKVKLDTQTDAPSIEGSNNALTVGNKLDAEALEIINKIVVEQNPNKTKDLTYLFNQNQTKKTMIRVNKLNELMDLVTDQAIDRFKDRPDNISNAELLQAMKVVQDTIERGQKQITGVNEQPLIQINQQTNKVNLSGPENMPKESRDRIRGAVMDFLGQLAPTIKDSTDTTVIDVSAESEETKDEH